MNTDDSSKESGSSFAFDKCISVLTNAQNDNERFGALLLVTRVVQSDKIDSSQRKQLFDSIGFSFINRLLRTKKCKESVLYKSLAVAILACFATDEQLLFHSQMVSKVESLNEILIDPLSDETIWNDAYQILFQFSSLTEGCKILSNKGTPSILCNIISCASPRATNAWNILTNISSLACSDMWSANPNPLIVLVFYCAEQLKTLQDSQKFIYCTHLINLLSLAEAQVFRDALEYLGVPQKNKLLSNLASGIGDILQGRVTSLQRDPAIILVSILLSLLDITDKWSFLNNRNAVTSKADFLTLITTLVSIEVRMALNESTAIEMIKKSTLIISCYNILEAVVSYLIMVTDDNTPKPNNRSVTKIFSKTSETMMSVISFLQQESNSYEDNFNTSHAKSDLVLASARVLLAWLAEESVSLEKEVNKILPFLLKIARNTLPRDQPNEQEYEQENNTTIELIRFMLPALCHLSADDASRKILIENGTVEILTHYYGIVWHRFEVGRSLDSKTTLITLLGVFLNFVVTEKKLVKDDNCFKKMLFHVMGNAFKADSLIENFDLLANMVVLGLMLLTHHGQNESITKPKMEHFFLSVVGFFKEADKLCKSKDETLKSLWLSVRELWFLAIQVLTEILSELNRPIVEKISSDLCSSMITLLTEAKQSQQGIDH